MAETMDLGRVVVRLVRTHVASELWQRQHLAWSLVKDDPTRRRTFLQARNEAVQAFWKPIAGLRGPFFAEALRQRLSRHRQRLSTDEIVLFDGALAREPGRVQSLVELSLSTLRAPSGPAPAVQPAEAPAAAAPALPVVWVIYEAPSFFRAGFAVRAVGGTDFYGAADLDAARKKLPPELDLVLRPSDLSEEEQARLLGQDPDQDHGAIVELWTT